ncbi:MAG: N-acetylglucosamine-6-phosphate deacetylase [Nocardioidaceae bacterium]
MTERYLADHVVLPDSVHSPGWVEVDGRSISAVGADAPGQTGTYVGAWLLPGFVDIHCHGGGGAAFTGGQADAQSAAALHEASGTTAMLASLVSAPVDVLVDQIRGLAGALGEGGLGAVRGIHLEGPFLAPDYRGAHDPAALCAPTASAIDRLLEAGDGHIAMVTMAPELPGGDEAIARLTAAGVTVAVGHTAAGYERTAEALAAGATVLTHACNAMPAVHHRAPGPLVAALESPACRLELILDGVHLHDAWARRVLEDAGRRAVLVTDAMAAAGARDGTYDLGGLDVVVADGVARLADGGSIAGSTLRMDQAFRRAAATLGQGPVAAAHAAATAPAAAMGWSDELGRVAAGLAASFVVAGDGFGVERVMRDGTWVRGGPA